MFGIYPHTAPYIYVLHLQDPYLIANTLGFYTLRDDSNITDRLHILFLDIVKVLLTFHTVIHLHSTYCRNDPRGDCFTRQRRARHVGG